MIERPVIAAWRPPFATGYGEEFAFQPGDSIGTMVDGCPALKPWAFRTHGRVVLHGRDGSTHEIAREHWDRVRIKPGQTLTFHVNLQGGGGGSSGGKSGIGAVIAIAAFVLATIVTGGGAAPLAPAFFAAGSIGAKLLATSILIAGSLAASALSAPPAQEAQDPREQRSTTASVEGNVLTRGASIPRVIGTRDVYPPFLCQPLITRDGKDEWVEALVGLAGPHQLSDIRVGDTPIADAANVEFEVREGWDDDLPISLITRYASTDQPQTEMTAHDFDEDSSDQTLLVDQVDPAKSLPQWNRFRAATADELRMELTLPAGLWNQKAETQVNGMSLRVRVRAEGETDWVNLPELVLASNINKESRHTLKFLWGEEQGARPNPASAAGWVAARKATPAPVNGFGEAWAADAMFSAGSGKDAYIFGAAGDGLTNVRRVHMGQHDATIWLDPATVPQGPMEIEVKRSGTYIYTAAAMTAYTLHLSTIIDPFGYLVSGADAKLFRSPSGISDKLYILRVAVIRNAHPINGGRQGSRLALIAIRVKNRALGKIKVRASGYVRDWDGTGWRTWTTTSNPAPHYRDVLTGRESGDPMPEDLVDDAKLVAWRTRCIDNDYTCDMVCEGAGVAEVLGYLASCGYARPWASERYGVIMDYDRTGESPVQIFGPRNSNNLSMSKAFARLPDAFRVKFREADNDDKETEIMVFRPGRGEVASPRIEEITYVGITDEAKATARARFDLAQAQHRSAFWSLDVPAEALVCERGDMIGINHFVMERQQASARILDIEWDGANVVAITLDADVDVWNEPDFTEVDDVTLIDDITLIGRKTGVVIRQSDGSMVTKPISGVTGSRSRLAFAVPFEPDEDGDGLSLVRAGNLVTIGDIGREVRRLVVIGIQPKEDFSFSLTAVAEAPEIWAA